MTLEIWEAVAAFVIIASMGFITGYDYAEDRVIKRIDDIIKRVLGERNDAP